MIFGIGVCTPQQPPSTTPSAPADETNEGSAGAQPAYPASGDGAEGSAGASSGYLLNSPAKQEILKGMPSKPVAYTYTPPQYFRPSLVRSYVTILDGVPEQFSNNPLKVMGNGQGDQFYNGGRWTSDDWEAVVQPQMIVTDPQLNDNLQSNEPVTERFFFNRATGCRHELPNVQPLIDSSPADPKLAAWVDYCADVTDSDVREFRNRAVSKFAATKNSPVRLFPIKQFPQDPLEIPRSDRDKQRVMLPIENPSPPSQTDRIRTQLPYAKPLFGFPGPAAVV